MLGLDLALKLGSHTVCDDAHRTEKASRPSTNTRVSSSVVVRKTYTPPTSTETVVAKITENVWHDVNSAGHQHSSKLKPPQVSSGCWPRHSCWTARSNRASSYIVTVHCSVVQSTAYLDVFILGRTTLYPSLWASASNGHFIRRSLNALDLLVAPAVFGWALDHDVPLQLTNIGTSDAMQVVTMQGLRSFHFFLQQNTWGAAYLIHLYAPGCKGSAGHTLRHRPS